MLGSWAAMALIAMQVGQPEPADAPPLLTAADFEKRLPPFEYREHQPQEIRVQIHQRLPPFRFILIPRPESRDRGVRWGPSPDNPEKWIPFPTKEERPPEIIVIRREDRDAVQALSFHSLGVLRSFEAHDVDFDGHLDISVVKVAGGKWAERRFWRFDPASGRFVETARTRALGRQSFGDVHFDSARREIRDKGLRGHLPEVRAYRWRGDDLELVETWQLQEPRLDTRQVAEVPPGQCLSVHSKRVNGRMQVVGRPAAAPCR